HRRPACVLDSRAGRRSKACRANFAAEPLADLQPSFRDTGETPMLPSARRHAAPQAKLQRHFVPGYDRTVPPGHFATGSRLVASDKAPPTVTGRSSRQPLTIGSESIFCPVRI